MEQQEFDDIVRRTEQLARDNPRAYRLRVIALASLGFGYLTLVLFGLLVAIGALGYLTFHGGGVLAGKLGLGVLLLVGVILRAFWVRFDPPKGQVLSRTNAPKLFGVIDDVIRRTGAPKLSKVLLIPHLNAAIQQRPRFGPIFGYRNYLLIGLPMLDAVSEEEFGAILAHECGHLSRSHGKVTAWVYRLRATWGQLAAALEAKRHWARALFLPFFHWYAPRFAAYSFVMARQREYEADRIAVATTSAAVSASALLRTAFAAQWLDERFWPAVSKRPEGSAQPDIDPYTDMRTELHHGFATQDCDRWLAAALSRDTGTSDTHPSLRDRLQALGVSPTSVLPPVAKSAALVLLADRRAAFAAELNAQWRRDVADRWKSEHAARVERRNRREVLTEQAASATLTVEEQLELAQLYQANDDAARAQPLLETVIASRPDCADAHAYLGALLAERDDPTAITHLQLAIQHDAEWTASAGAILYRQFMKVGCVDEAKSIAAKIRSFHLRAETARREKEKILGSHQYVKLAVPDDDRNAIKSALLRERKNVKGAWLVGRVPQGGHAPIPLLVIEQATAPWRLESRQVLAERLVETIPVPPGTQIVVLSDAEHWLLDRALRIEGARLIP
jgi:Zn-dependent protease with chaperone function